MITCDGPLVTVPPDDQAAVHAAVRRRDLVPRVRERLEMVKAAMLGHDLPTIAHWSGRSEATICHWLSRFLGGGLDVLDDAPRRGRPPKADAAYLALLERIVLTPPRDLGLAVDVWTSASLSAYLAAETGVTIAPGWLRVLLSRQRFVCGRPKHTLEHLQDADELARCEAELAQVGEKGGYPAGALRTARPG
jgi:transposase